MARLLLLPLLLALFVAQRGVDGLHADRAGKEDWMRRHVGRVINAVPAVSECVHPSVQCLVGTLAAQIDDSNRRDARQSHSHKSQQHTTQGPDALIVASEQGAIASLATRDGGVKWRHILPGEEAVALDVVVAEGPGLVLAVSRCVAVVVVFGGVISRLI